jgi:hypothetical protein
MLRVLIAGSSLPERYEMVQIINNVRNPDEREMRLRILNGGRPYRKIYEDLFPLLRRVNIKVEYNIRQIIDNQPPKEVEGGDSGKTKTDSLPPQTGDSKVTIKEPKKKRAYPIVLKTNLMSWAGITPDVKFRTIMPNLAAEVHLNDNWSVMGSITYSYWNFDTDQQFWGVSGYSIEPRYWLNRFIPWVQEDHHSGVYVGGYVQYGDFDYCLDIKETKRTNNYTGNYAQAGISAGYHWQINPVWGIELGLRGGYQYSRTKIYDIESPKYFLKEKLTENKIRIDGLNLSVTYKFK